MLELCLVLELGLVQETVSCAGSGFCAGTGSCAGIGFCAGTDSCAGIGFRAETSVESLVGNSILGNGIHGVLIASIDS